MTPTTLPRLVLLLPLALASQAASATTWICTLSEDLVQLVCVADEATPQLEPVAAPARPVAQVRGTAFPLDPRREYRVDLWTPPTDLSWVAHLARASICYRSPGCEVVMAQPRYWPGNAPNEQR